MKENKVHVNDGTLLPIFQFQRKSTGDSVTFGKTHLWTGTAKCSKRLLKSSDRPQISLLSSDMFGLPSKILALSG